MGYMGGNIRKIWGIRVFATYLELLSVKQQKPVMKIFGADISTFLIDFFKTNLKKISAVKDANKLLEDISGIKGFFNKEEEFTELKSKMEGHIAAFEAPDRRAYGDFQTNEDLASKIVEHIQTGGLSPRFMVEPTCGKGQFILAALKHFPTLEKVVGIEIYYPYVWEAKLGILELFLRKEHSCKPRIEIIHEDIFSFDLGKLAKDNKHLSTLVIGNPPWVTNSELSTLNVDNLPEKSNFKHHKGIEAITGKGNFDIGEFISIQILKNFDTSEGTFAFLVKSSVVKNILHEQERSKYKIAHIRKLNIDTKKEFNVSVDACLFLTSFNSSPEYTCRETDFYSQEDITEFGWYKGKFVYSIKEYNKVESLDGKSPFVWRQGMKHDCSKIMELDQANGHFINGFKEEVMPEQSLLYGLLKSSDLKNEVIRSYRKTTIVTQKKVGQDTSYIKREYPKTYQYLNKNRAWFDKRKSSIYKGKPPFSIFGIGDYSFAKYKVAISGMYKRTTFSLVLPENDKPLMLDDTCYFVGFETIEEAKMTQKILNSTRVQSFLKAIIFSDAKRPITKDVLMRIDIRKAYDMLDSEATVCENPAWQLFGEKLKEKEEHSSQMTLF